MDSGMTAVVWGGVLGMLFVFSVKAMEKIVGVGGLPPKKKSGFQDGPENRCKWFRRTMELF
jgi:hypothetical protein